jgi:hypothetical protein
MAHPFSFRWTDAVFIVILPSRLDGHEDGSPMEDAERFRLLGKYRTPRFRFGRKALCEIRAEVTICGMTDALIPWPIGKARRGRTSLIISQGTFGGDSPGVQPSRRPLVGD